VDDWCCHPDPFVKKLLPGAEDCLVGDTFLLLARDASCAETLTQEESPDESEESPDSKVQRALFFLFYSGRGRCDKDSEFLGTL